MRIDFFQLDHLLTGRNGMSGVVVVFVRRQVESSLASFGSRHGQVSEQVGLGDGPFHHSVDLESDETEHPRDGRSAGFESVLT